MKQGLASIISQYYLPPKISFLSRISTSQIQKTSTKMAQAAAAPITFSLEDLIPLISKKGGGFQLGTKAEPLVVVRAPWKGSFVTNKDNGQVFPVGDAGGNGAGANGTGANKQKKAPISVQVQCLNARTVALVQAFDKTPGIWDATTTANLKYNSLVTTPEIDAKDAEGSGGVVVVGDPFMDGLIFRLNLSNDYPFKSSDPGCCMPSELAVGHKFVAHARFHQWKNTHYGISLYVDACEVVGFDPAYPVPAVLKARGGKKRKIDEDGNSVVVDPFEWDD
jgi:hypothetical protein